MRKILPVFVSLALLRSMVDGFLTKFESELLKPQINISLKDIGFSNY
ncbi:MAG: hypothetical protein U0L84_04730 [Acutalibacteraceae bacterium]|nr:hypothetical protein [Acutalibacteraceae bacterium]